MISINLSISIMDMNADFINNDLAAKCWSKYELYSELTTKGCISVYVTGGYSEVFQGYNDWR